MQRKPVWMKIFEQDLLTSASQSTLLLTLDSLRQKSPSLMAGMLWNGLMARYSGWSTNVIVMMDNLASSNKIAAGKKKKQTKVDNIYLHVFTSHEITFFELIRHTKNLGCHFHNPKSCKVVKKSGVRKHYGFDYGMINPSWEAVGRVKTNM